MSEKLKEMKTVMNNIGFVLPGQGSQYKDMGKSLHDRYLIASRTFEEASDVQGIDMKKLCFDSDEDKLSLTSNAQPAILTVSVAAFRVYMEEYGIAPRYTAGHSLGEYSALTCAGVIEFSDALRIVTQRGKLMQEAVTAGLGKMVAISNVNVDEVTEACRQISNGNDYESVVISNYNSPNQLVISGIKSSVDSVVELLKGKGAKALPLKVSSPFHSPLMEPASIKLEQELRKYTYAPFKWQVISNVTALPYMGTHEIVETLKLQLTYPVKWYQSLEYMHDHGLFTVIEMGPKSVLSNLINRNFTDMRAYSFDSEKDLHSIDECLKQYKQFENSKTTILKKCITAAISVKNTNWDDTEYQKGVIEPYKHLNSILEKNEADGSEPSDEQIIEARAMLNLIFKAKKVSVLERCESFNELFGAEE